MDKKWIDWQYFVVEQKWKQNTWLERILSGDYFPRDIRRTKKEEQLLKDWIEGNKREIL